MKLQINSFFLTHVALPVAIAVILGLFLSNPGPALAVLALITIIWWSPIYLRYAQDNPKHLWFKNKMFGWGWTPVTWQGWAVTAAYAALLVLIFGDADLNSPSSTTTLLRASIPFIVATFLFLFIAYKKGEKPQWRWGEDINKYRKN